MGRIFVDKGLYKSVGKMWKELNTEKEISANTGLRNAFHLLIPEDHICECEETFGGYYNFLNTFFRQQGYCCFPFDWYICCLIRDLVQTTKLL